MSIFNNCLRHIGRVALICALAGAGVNAAQAEEAASPTLFDMMFGEKVSSADEIAIPREGKHAITLKFYLDNDSRYLKPNSPTDRWYTNGIAFTVTGQPDFAQDMAKYMPFAKQFGPAYTAVGVAIGQFMFTPKDLSAPNPNSKDHPYAGYNFVGLYWQRADKEMTTMDHFEVDLGMVGPMTAADTLQTQVHRCIGGVHPEGWGHQLSNEVTFQAYLRKKWRIRLGEWGSPSEPFAIELIPNIGAALGTVYRYVEGDIWLRMGFNLPLDFGPGRMNDWQSAMQPAGSHEGLGIYLFGRVGGQIVEHNMFLNGNNFSNSRSVTPEVFVGEVQGGMTLSYQMPDFAFEVTYSQTFQSKNFTTQSSMHSWGSWGVSMSWLF